MGGRCRCSGGGGADLSYVVALAGAVMSGDRGVGRYTVVVTVVAVAVTAPTCKSMMSGPIHQNHLAYRWRHISLHRDIKLQCTRAKNGEPRLQDESSSKNSIFFGPSDGANCC